MPISIKILRKAFYELTTYCRNKLVCLYVEYGTVIIVTLIFCHPEDREIRTLYYVA